MKRFVALLCAVLLLCSLSVAAFADAPDTKTVKSSFIDWSYDDMSGAYDGTWYTIGKCIDIYLPNDWVDIDLSQSTGYDNAFYGACDDGVDHTVVFYYYSPDKCKDAFGTTFSNKDEIAAELTDLGYDPNACRINGIGCCTFINDESDEFSVMFLDDEGGLYRVSFYPFSDDTGNWQDYINDMCVSLSLPEA